LASKKITHIQTALNLAVRKITMAINRQWNWAQTAPNFVLLERYYQRKKFENF